LCHSNRRAGDFQLFYLFGHINVEGGVDVGLLVGGGLGTGRMKDDKCEKCDEKEACSGESFKLFFLLYLKL
jgi:hypothetical protein